MMRASALSQQRDGDGNGGDDVGGLPASASPPQRPSPPRTSGGNACAALDAAAAACRARLAPLLEAARARLPAQRPLFMPRGGATGATSALCAALLVAPLAAWWAGVGAGVAAYEGRVCAPRAAGGRCEPVHHLLKAFDDAVMRPAGPALPFVALAARVAAALFAERLFASAPHGGGGSVGSSGADGASGRGPAAVLPSLARDCLLAYAAVALVRLAVYGVHLGLLRARLLGFHLVSDHLLLAGSALACLHVELAALASDAARARASRAPGVHQGSPFSRRDAPLAAAAAVTLALFALTAGDSFFTAKHFHHPGVRRWLPLVLSCVVVPLLTLTHTPSIPSSARAPS